MSRVVNAIDTSTINLKHNIQWTFLTKIKQPWMKLHSREYQLDDWHKKQKHQFKILFAQAFKEEQKETLNDRKLAVRVQLESEGKSEKEVSNAVKKVKIESFDENKSQVTVQRYLAHIKKFREAEKLKSAKSKDTKLLGGVANDHKLVFVRNNREIRMFDTHPFFKQSADSNTIGWQDFKTNVFYDYINQRNSFLDVVQREKRIVKTIDLSWNQLQEENTNKDITYDMLKKRLQKFKHTLDDEFFEQPFWLEKGDHVITDLDVQFKQGECQIKMSDADVYQMIKDLKNEQNVEFEEMDVKLGQDGLTYDTKQEATSEEPKSPSLLSRLSSSLSRKKSNNTAGTHTVMIEETQIVNDAELEGENDDPTSQVNQVAEEEGEDEEDKQQVVVEVNPNIQAVLESSETVDALNSKTIDSLQVSELTTTQAQEILSKLQSTLGNDDDAPPVDVVHNLVLAAQNQLDQHNEQFHKSVLDISQEAKDKTTGFVAVLSKKSTVEKNKQDYDIKIAGAVQVRDSFQADSHKILDFLKCKYRKALAKTRPNGCPQDASNEHVVSWKELVGEESSVGVKSRTSKSGTSEVKVSAVSVVLPVTLEDSLHFEAQLAHIKRCFHVHHAKDESLKLPSCIDYSNELPPCEAQEQSHPGCLDSILLIKEWQEYKNYGLKEKLSLDYLVQTLDACHHKNSKAVNLCVKTSIWDALALCKLKGVPTCNEFIKFCDRSKSKTAQWIREHNARFKMSCRKHMFDSILLVKGFVHIQLALARYGPLLCSFPVYDSTKVKFWEKCGEIRGYHTMVLTGYDLSNGGSLILRNTLGREHGDFGHLRVSFKSFLVSDAVVVLCSDSTKPLCGARVPWNQDPDGVEKDSKQLEADSPALAGASPPPAGGSQLPGIEVTHVPAVLVAQATEALAQISFGQAESHVASQLPPPLEDNLIREAKKQATDFINSRSKGAFQGLDFDLVGFKFPPSINGGFTALVPEQTGVACIGFAAPNAVKTWDPSASGYYVYLNQTTKYLSSNLKDVVQVTLSTNSQIRWQVMHAGNLLTAPATLVVENAGKTLLQQTVLLSVDVKQTNNPKIMKVVLP